MTEIGVALTFAYSDPLLRAKFFKKRASTICTEISVKIVRQIVLVFCSQRKQEWDLVVPFTKLR